MSYLAHLDDYSRKILNATSRSPKSATELSRLYGIPIATCYERIRSLEGRGLLRMTATVFTEDGKAVAFYQRATLSARSLAELALTA